MLTNTGARKMLETGLFGGTTYLALKVGNAEVSGNGYVRKAVTASNFTFSANTVTNSADIDFISPTGAGTWGDVTAISLYSAQTGGNELFKVDLSNNPDAISQAGTRVFIPSGQLDITLALA